MRALKYILWVTCFGLASAGTPSFSETLAEFTNTCEKNLDISDIKGFDCSTGVVLPTKKFGNDCDAKAILGGVGCMENSRLGRMTFSYREKDELNPDVVGVWTCRKYENKDIATDAKYYDIAMIIHNRKNGNTCYFQNKLDNTRDGPKMPDPEEENATNVWNTPTATAEIGCTRCHSNDPFIVTPHVADAFNQFSLTRFNPKGPYKVVGADFADFNNKIDRKSESCGGLCHFDSSPNSGSSDAITKHWMAPGALPNYTAYHFKPAAGQLYAMESNGRVWARHAFNTTAGGACTVDNTCPHWSILDGNSKTKMIAAAPGKLYQLHNDGMIWAFTGVPCGKFNSCPGWQQLDNNQSTKHIAAGGLSLYQLRADGHIWRYTGSPCSGSNCTGWQRLDFNPATAQIVAASGNLYQRHNNGAIWKYTGTPCTANACTGWQQLDGNSSTVDIVADGSALYQRHSNGRIWRYTGTPCSTSGCTGWQLIGSDSTTRQIVAGATNLYQRRSNGSIWQYISSSSSWRQLDNNASTVEISSSSAGLFQRRSNGTVWRFTGTACSNGSCPGWERILNFSNTTSLTAARQ